MPPPAKKCTERCPIATELKLRNPTTTVATNFAFTYIILKL
jgi:hypothetical protein